MQFRVFTATVALAPSLGWLFPARVICGIAAASISTVYADGDAARGPGRAVGTGGAAFGVGFVLGPALGRPDRRGPRCS